MKEKEIQSTIQLTGQMAFWLRQASDNAWSDINEQIEKVILAMTEIVEWAQKLIEAGADFPIDVVLQQIQNLNEAYTAKDEVLLADTLEYEITNTLYVYLEQGEE